MRSILPIPTMMPWLELHTPQVASKHAISNQGIQPRMVTLTWKETIFVFETSYKPIERMKTKRYLY